MTTRALAFLVLALAPACGSDESEPDDGFRIEDQSGAEFYWVCEDDDCDVHRIAGVSPEVPCSDGWYGPLLSRFIEVTGVCPLSSGAGFGLRMGRYLVCEEDEDCPELTSDEWTYECRAGLCQHTDTVRYPAGLPMWHEAFTLCEGYEPRNFGPIVVETPQDPLDVAIYAACPDMDYPYGPCESLPAECIDPR